MNDASQLLARMEASEMFRKPLGPQNIQQAGTTFPPPTVPLPQQYKQPEPLGVVSTGAVNTCGVLNAAAAQQYQPMQPITTQVPGTYYQYPPAQQVYTQVPPSPWPHNTAPQTFSTPASVPSNSGFNYTPPVFGTPTVIPTFYGNVKPPFTQGYQ